MITLGQAKLIKPRTTIWSTTEIRRVAREKIIREIDGVEWYRYEVPRVSWTINEIKIVGIMKPTFVGEWDQSEHAEDLEWKWCCYDAAEQNEKSTGYHIMDEWCWVNMPETYFLTEKSARSHVSALENKQRELDRT